MRYIQPIQHTKSALVCRFRWLCFVLLSILHVSLFGQQQGQLSRYVPDPARVQEAIAKVQSGNCFPVYVTMIADAKAVEAIPALEKQFTLQTDTNTKAAIASALVRLGRE